MKIFSKKIFILIGSLIIFFLVAYISIKILPLKSIPYNIRITRVHSFLLVVDLIIFLTWICIGPIFGTLFLATSIILILLLATGFGFGFFLRHFLIIFGIFSLAHYFYSRHIEIRNRKQLRLEDSEEKRNTILNQYHKQEQVSKALDKKMYRYSSLKNITENLSSALLLDDLAKSIVQNTINLIGKSDICLLYLVDEERLELTLISSRSKKKKVHVKEKKGDVFDQWVFRQRHPLNIMDISKDFRFSSEDVEDISRDFKSILSSPMITENRVVGILRLDSSSPEAYTPDDLRLLDIISDLGAVSLENAVLYKRIEELAIRDDLTGVFVRRYFKQRYTEEFDRVVKYQGKLNLLMLDIDHFKQYNDTYGHTAGDIVLKEVSEILSKNVGAEDVVARYGGEEFIILLLGKDKSSAVEKADYIRKKVQEHPIILRRKKTGITVSIGVANYPQDSKLKGELVHQADISLYKAKTEGRNKVCYL